VTAPAEALAGTWHEQVPALVDAARTLLRLGATDPDLPRLTDCARAACFAVDQRLALRMVVGARATYSVGGLDVVTYLDGDVPADVWTAATQLTAELFRRKDAPFGIAGGFSPTGESMRISADHMRGVDSLLAPYVEGWGFA
jgi:hypothetical protein